MLWNGHMTRPSELKPRCWGWSLRLFYCLLPDVRVPPAVVPAEDQVLISLVNYSTDSVMVPDICPIDILMVLMDSMGEGNSVSPRPGGGPRTQTK